ncbi:cytochrome P450 [Actinophytocola sp.]|uniref:cytochrome P450 n=1 Tax=Actinophytocola sp. TaxID=1872138 RepID=UPI002ED24CA2
MTGVESRVDAVRLYGPEYQKDPMARYAEIREVHGPVAPVLLEGDVPAWFVCGYRELHQVTADSQLFARDPRRWNGWDLAPDGWPLMVYMVHNASVMFTEGAEHRRRAGAISDALEAVDQFELATQCERIADQLIDRFAGRGEAELMSQYASRIPLSAVATMCGMPEAVAHRLVEDVMSTVTSPEAMAEANIRILEAVQLLVDRKREYPGGDIPSRLLTDQANLSGEEIVLDLLLLLLQAHQQTTNWIGNTLQLMLTDERFAINLSGGRASVGDALNEVLWHNTPTQNFLGRVATSDTTLGGQRIRNGDLIVLGLAAANADPQVRPDHGTGGNRAMMSFGHGEHGCPYPAPELAEIIAKASVEVLIDRLPDLVLATPPDTLEWRTSVWARGLLRLPVTFTPTHVQ